MRLQVGLACRLTPTYPVGPRPGVTLTDFLWARPSGARGYADTHDRKISTFVFGGIGGRIDL